MSTTNNPSTKKASINYRTVSGRLKHLRFFSKTNRIVFLLALLVVLLSGCPGGSGGAPPPDPTAVGSDGSSEESQALPYYLHDFKAFIAYLTIWGGVGGFRIAGAFLLEAVEVNSPEYAVNRVAPVGIIRPCSSGSATFTPLNESALNYHYIAEKCFYPEDSEYVKSGFYDGGYKYVSSGDSDNSEIFIELDRYFAVPEAESISDRQIPPQDFRPLLSGTQHITRVEDETGLYTVTDAVDEMTIHGHGSVRNFSWVYKSNSEGSVSYAVNYDVSQTVRDPVVVEGYVHQLMFLGGLMMGSGVSRPGNPRGGALANDTYELQVRTLEAFNYRDKSIISGTYTINLVSHNISVKVHHFEGGADVTYTNNGETQTKTVQD